MLRPQQSSNAGKSSQDPFRSIRFRHLPWASSAPSRNLTLSSAKSRTCRCKVWLPGRNDKDTCHVVCAVPVLGSRLAEKGVLESAALVCHGDEVVEVRFGCLLRCVHTSDSRSVMI